MQRKPTWTVGDVARYCGMPPAAVLRRIEDGDLRVHKLPDHGDLRIQIEDLLDFLDVLHIAPCRQAEPDRPGVLIVEDDHSLGRSLERQLHRAGYETQTATDGFRAGKLVRKWRPAVVTLDLMIPGLSGFDFLSLVRNTPELAETRILVLSGMPEATLREAGRVGADEVLTKPTSGSALFEAVERLVAARHHPADRN